MDPELYRGRGQTWVKHHVLKWYLQKLAYKVGSWCDCINYVDCFAGPWNQKSEALRDTSPFIAIQELREARRGLRSIGKYPRIRCLFVEKDPQAHGLLSSKLESVSDIETSAVLGELESSIEQILAFCDETRGTAFNFFFIDPTGWTGFALETIQPLLRLPRSEVLINFMTQFISRFVDGNLGPAETESFRRLFGGLEIKERWRHLEGLDREDEIVAAYSDLIRAAGNYEHMGSTVVLHPTEDRTHFHLIYGTGKPAGLRVFRNNAERKAIKAQRSIRWAALNEKVEDRTGQTSLFEEPVTVTYLDSLIRRYREKMKASVSEKLHQHESILFDDLEMCALRWPFMNTTTELNVWLKELKEEGQVRFEGLEGRQRVPKAGKNHRIAWIGPPRQS